MIAIVARYSPTIERYSIDEVFAEIENISHTPAFKKKRLNAHLILRFLWVLPIQNA
ncbi:MAG: hypothetical protein UZ22_OP11002000111 [Microgenomates bacterium OLB23]|nr:MAG: hypothetical protein UZ22_OP11002000111 [Microgenomates bacterium OLB23]